VRKERARQERESRRNAGGRHVGRELPPPHGRITRIAKVSGWLITTGLAVYAAYAGCKNNKELKAVSATGLALQNDQYELARRVASSEHRPEITIVDAEKGRAFYEQMTPPTISGRSVETKVRVSVVDSFRIVNTGLGRARTLVTVCRDTLALDPYLRERMKTLPLASAPLSADPFDAEIPFRTLEPGESSWVVVCDTLRSVDHRAPQWRCVLHVIMYYDDEFGTLFDTYFLGLYILPKNRAAVVHQERVDLPNGTTELTAELDQDLTGGRMLTIKSTCERPHIYEKAEGDSLRSRFEMTANRRRVP